MGIPAIDKISLFVADGYGGRTGSPDTPKHPIGLRDVGRLEIRTRRYVRTGNSMPRSLDPATMRVFAIIRALVFALWPMAAVAAPLSTSLEADKWWWSLGMATLGTLTAVLGRINAQIEAQSEDQPTKKPLTGLQWSVLVASQMSFCWLAGAIFYLLGLHWQLPPYVLPVTVALASFGGARSVEYAMTRWLQK